MADRDDERKGAAFTIRSRRGHDYSGSQNTGTTSVVQGSYGERFRAPKTARQKAFSQAMTREKIAHEVAMGEHRED